MCGIVGVVSTKPESNAKEREKFFRTALIVDQIRGFHSTGFFKVNRPYGLNDKSHGSVSTVKKAFNANDFMELKAVDSALSMLSSAEILIGHNRWATMGNITHATAHPFTHGPVTLVHNGTLHFYDDLPGSEKFDVDSEAIAYALSVTEPDKATEILEKLDGAYALVWYDSRIGQLRAARNDERPLHFTHTSDGENLLLASEAGMLEWLADRNGFKTQEVWQLKEGVMITLDRDDLTKYEAKDFTVLDDSWYKTGYGNGYDWNRYSAGKSKTPEKKGEGTKKDGKKTYNQALLDSFGLKAGGEICFDPQDFEYYVSHDKTPPNYKGPRFGRLTGVTVCPGGQHIYTQVDGLKAEEWEEAVGYSIVAEVVNIVDKPAMDNKPARMELRCKSPSYIEDYVIDEVTGEAVPALDEEWEDEGTHDRYGPFNSRINDKRWFELIEHGCAMCGGDIADDEDDLTGWDSNGNPICKHCMSQNGWDQLSGI